MGNFKEEIALTQAIILDVDGVFTDGGITPLPDGDFLRTYCAKDGYAVSYAIKAGMKVFIITGGRGDVLKKRFEYLQVTEMHMNIADKLSVLEDIISRHGLDPKRLIFMGDDIPDLECMRAVGIPVCPADAASEIIDASVYISEFGGGKGCVRDILEQVLRAQNKWAKHLKGVNTIRSA